MNRIDFGAAAPVTTKVFRIATMVLISGAAFACATQHDAVHEWTAQGYLTPGPTGIPEIIGVYDNESDCVAAGEAWMSRQVVGNPVFADCLPVDHN
jgi:hypothetical protein